jgi:branched-chain amino acid aminotransferase
MGSGKAKRSKQHLLIKGKKMANPIDWKNLGFNYMQTACYLKCDYAGGAWGEFQVCTDPHISLHIAATCLHYGQEAFEGLKAFGRKDQSVAIFRPRENARRLIRSAQRLVMEAPSEELFLSMAAKLVQLNMEYVPPYGTGASLYIRPCLIGTSPHIGVHPSEEYTLIMLASPMGPYYKTGFLPVKAYIQEEFDRAAPRGVGFTKAGGNYAAGMMGDRDGQKRGFPICLYLDSASHQFIDEFGTSNFLAITKDHKYVTPASPSILESVTNTSLQIIARDFGLGVEKRPIRVDELADFAEVGACGTAVVITPVSSITHGSRVYTFGKEKEAGATLAKLYNEIQAIQYGDVPDRHGWMVPVPKA